jgi:fibronectin type 3 domain-containing protein
MRTAFTRQFSSIALLTALFVLGSGASGLGASGLAQPGPVTATGSASLSPTHSPSASPSPAASPSATPRSGTPSPSPTASPSPSATYTATVIPTVPAADLPQAPGQALGAFVVLTSTGQAPVPAVQLQWYPAEAGDYMIRGYRVYRGKAGTGDFERRPEGATQDTSALELDDPASIGDDYDYYVVAVDSKGREGARSPLETVDLRDLPPERLAPPEPEGLTATSRKDDVKLRWKTADAWIWPWSAYRIYRATTVAGLPRGLLAAVTSSAADSLALAAPAAAPVRPVSPPSRDWNSFANFSNPSPNSVAPAAASPATSTAQTTTATAQAATSTAQAQAATATAAAPAPPGEFFYYYDSPTAEKVDYYYAVTSLDRAGHESPMSVTVLARATGPLPPGRPMELTATSKTEQVILNWEPAAPGTADLSGYILNRRATDSETWRKVAMLGVSDTTYSDSLDGGSYIYRLSAYDAVGNTGEAAYIGANPVDKILNNTLIITMPTAYANNPGRDNGFNLNVLFDFYVGSLFESYTNPITHAPQSSIFQPLEIGTVSTDLKYAFLNDTGWVPGFAVGLYTSALIGFGGGNAETVGISSSGGNLATLGDVYAVVSKRFLPSNPNAAVHFGYMHGDLSQDLTENPIPSWAWPTIGHLTPGGAVPELLSSFVDPALGQAVGQSPNMVYFGLQFPFTVPLGFTDWRSGLRLEVLLPLAWEAEYPPSEPAGDTATENGNPASQLPYLINIHVDNLPLFGFEFGVFKFSGGYEVIAFYHIPDLNWAW